MASYEVVYVRSFCSANTITIKNLSIQSFYLWVKTARHRSEPLASRIENCGLLFWLQAMLLLSLHHPDLYLQGTSCPTPSSFFCRETPRTNIKSSYFSSCHKPGKELCYKMWIKQQHPFALVNFLLRDSNVKLQYGNNDQKTQK